MNLYPNIQDLQLFDTPEVTMSTLSIEHVKDMLIKFDGTKSKLFEFIDNCDKANSVIKEDHKKLLFTLIETKLTDNARAIVRNRRFEKWSDLKVFLLDAYSERRTSSQWQLELNSCKQNLNEPVISYANKIENCYLKLINTLKSNLTNSGREACVELLKEQALNVFISGLQKDLCILVKSQKPNSLEEAISIAQSEEQELKSKTEMNKYQNYNSNSNNKICNFCNKMGHTFNNCRKRNNNFQNQNIRHFSQNKNQNNYQSPKICNYCKNKGHLINECRKRQFNAKNKNNMPNQMSNPQASTSTFNPNLNSRSFNTNPNSNSNYQNQPLNGQGSGQQATLSRNAHHIKVAYQ